MTLIKKLIFAPFFFISFVFLLYKLNPLFNSYDFIFTLSTAAIIQLIIVAGLISLTSLFLVLFASLAYDWKFVLPIGILAFILPMVFVKDATGLILAAGTLVILLLTYLALENTLKNYLNFEPASLFGPHIRRLGTFLILVITLAYFLSINKTIHQTGFQIPDLLIEQALKITAPPQKSVQEQTTQPLPSITPEQIELLKQYGLDPKAPADLTQDVLKQAVKDQLEVIIQPYLNIIPAILAILFFFILYSLVSLLNLLIYPLLWGIFYILEKTGFVKFETEQRTVKKLVI